MREAEGMRNARDLALSASLPPPAFLFRTAHRVEYEPNHVLERKVVFLVQRAREFLEISTRALLGLVGGRT